MEELAREINKLIKNSDVYKRYLSCKSSVENDEELNALKIKLEELKKDNCKHKNECLINQYYELEKEYKNNVLVKEYDSVKKEVYELLASVSDILSFK